MVEVSQHLRQQLPPSASSKAREAVQEIPQLQKQPTLPKAATTTLTHPHNPRMPALNFTPQHPQLRLSEAKKSPL